MKKQKSVEEQVAALTEKEKETVLKVAKYGTLAIYGLGIPIIALLAIGLIGMITDYSLYDERAIGGFFISVILGLAIIVAIFLFIKIRFPYYNDKVAAYIKKNKKNS